MPAGPDGIVDTGQPIGGSGGGTVSSTLAVELRSGWVGLVSVLAAGFSGAGPGPLGVTGASGGVTGWTGGVTGWTGGATGLACAAEPFARRGASLTRSESG
jgi:hypothetical protein